MSFSLSSQTLPQLMATEAGRERLRLELINRLRSKALSRQVELSQRKESLLEYQGDPAGFINHVLGEHLWSKQRLICEAVVKHRKVAVPACHGLGKSFCASRLVAWWITSSPIGDAFAVTTAPTEKQVKSILWREINRAYKKGGLPGKVNQTEWFIDNELVAYGRKPADTDMTGFQGIHARKVLVLFDEACGIPKALFDGGDSLTTSAGSRMLAIGNPDDPSSEFARICQPGSGWHVIPVSAFDTPNFTGEAIPDGLRDLLVSTEWVEEKRIYWGAESPLYKAKVLGKFSDVSEDGLIAPSWVNAAIERTLTPGPNDDVELGVDVARFGGDESIIYWRHGPCAKLIHNSRGNDLMKLVGVIVAAIAQHKPKRVKIDDSGVGGGVTDRLREMQRSDGLFANVEICPINVGQAARDKERFLNLRAELHWGLRERFQDGDIDIEDDDVTAGQLVAFKYWQTSRGQIQIESKEDLKKRLGKESGFSSPDRADALMLAYAPPAPQGGDGIFAFVASQAAKAAAEKDKQA